MPSIRNVAFRRDMVLFQSEGLTLAIYPDALTADRWMSIFTDQDLMTGVLHALHSDSATTVLDSIESGSLAPARVKRVIYSTISEVTGRPWWEALRLAASVTAGDGRVLGNLCLTGVRPEMMNIAAYLSTVWAFLTRNADEKDLFKLESQLKMLPPDAEDEDYDLFDEGDDFGETVRQLQNAPGVSLG